MNYIEVKFLTSKPEIQELISAIMFDAGAESAEEQSSCLFCYFTESVFSDANISEILISNELLKEIKFESKVIAKQNWNAEWEKSFKPILIDNKVGIRAPFHLPLHSEIELVIEPKMSFGTGHHETTSMMISLMSEIDFKDKRVIDFGCGTGVLSILACKMGAFEIFAIDNEEWAVENCIENRDANGCHPFQVLLGDTLPQNPNPQDVILANINKNVIIKNFANFSFLLKKNGILLLSGLLLSDEREISEEALRYGYKLHKKKTNNGWLALYYIKLL